MAATDTMSLQRKDWLALVAVHSDTWLLAVAFYNGARLNKAGRSVSGLELAAYLWKGLHSGSRA